MGVLSEAAALMQTTQAHKMRTSSKQSRWRTPVAMVDKLFDAFHFSIDLAADDTSRVCPMWLGPGSHITEDSLAVSSWIDCTKHYDVPPIGFINPPYSLGEIKELTDAGVARNDPRVECLRIENWARKAFNESEAGFTTIGVFPYAPQTEWFRWFVMGHGATGNWRGHAALDFWRIPHRVSFLQPDGSAAANANVNTCIIIWGPNPGFVGPWVPSGRYWSYR